MTDAPQSRYKVVERDRRLVVIDRWADSSSPMDQGTSEWPAAEPGWQAPIALNKTSFDGRSTLNTLALYDNNGPRAIALDANSAALVNGVKLALAMAVLTVIVLAVTYPATLLIVPVALNKAVRTPIRKRITAWLDGVAAASE
ncbi:MAG: hypothetical protein ACKVOB_03855 [Sphingomonas sp.]